MTYLNQVFLFVITTKAFNLAELNFFNLWYVSLLKQKIQALFFFFLSFQISHCSWKYPLNRTEFIAKNSKIYLFLKTESLQLKSSLMFKQNSVYSSLPLIPQDWCFHLFLKPQSKTSTA